MCGPWWISNASPYSEVFTTYAGDVNKGISFFGKADCAVVDDEIQRLNALWRRASDHGEVDQIIEEVLGAEVASRLDRFDAVQLAAVLRSCREHVTASSAGRALFAFSRLEKKSSNDADRLSKYLARFGLRFEDVKRQ